MRLKTAMLADGARAGSDGKLYIFGGQWDNVFAPVVPCTQKVAFAIVIEVDYMEALQPHQVEFVLVTEDGGEIGVRFAGQLQSGHPPLTQAGDSVAVALGIEPPPIPIPSYQRYVWKILLDGQEAGSLPMNVRPPLAIPMSPLAPNAAPPADS
jgi:hypothetical protein